MRKINLNRFFITLIFVLNLMIAFHLKADDYAVDNNYSAEELSRAGIDWSVDGEINFNSNSNLGRAQRERDIIEDKATLLNLGLIMNKEFESEKAISIRAFVESESWQEVKYLSRETLGVQFIYRWQNTLGFTAPFYQFNVTYQDDTYDADQRDTEKIKAQLFFTKRLTDQTTLTSGFEYQDSDAISNVFDLKQARFFINSDYNLSQNWTGYLGYSYIDGDTWSSAQDVFCNGAQANDIFGLISWSTAIDEDMAFNETFSGGPDCLTGHWLSYRLPAISQTLTLGINIGLSHSWSFDIGLTQVEVKADGNNEYDSTLLRASLLMRY